MPMCMREGGSVHRSASVAAASTAHLGRADVLCGASVAAQSWQRTRRHEASDVGGGAARVGNHEHRLREK